MRRLFLALFCVASMGLFSGTMRAQCALVKNEPQYGYVTLPGSKRNLTVHQTGCPSSTVSNIAMTGNTTTATVTFTVADASVFTVGKTVEAEGMYAVGYPFDEVLQGTSLTVTAASGTTVTAQYNNAEIILGSTAVTGVTLVQYSHVNWSTDAGTLSCASNCIPISELTTDATEGNVTTVEPYTPYPTGGYHLTSTHQIHVTATAVDNPSSSVVYTINQAARRNTVMIYGAQYTQAFEAQKKQLWAGVLGSTNQGIVWSITTQPAGGDAALSATNKRNTIFSATVPGRYKVTAASAEDGTKSAYEIIDVLPQAIPAWASAPPDKAGPQACGKPSDLTGNLYEVGPTHAYHTLNDAFTAVKNDAAQGSTVMVYNEDTSGTAPTTYPEYIDITGLNTADQPLNICGVPDSQGHLPVVTGENAHGPSWFPSSYLYGVGLLMTYPATGGCNGTSVAGGSCGPTHVRLAGIKVINVNPNYTFYEPDGTTTSTWGGDGIDIRTGANISIEGMNCYNTSQCVGTYANQNGGYAPLSQSILWQESYTGNNGISGYATSHPAYMQSLNGNVLDRVYIDAGTSGDQGSCIKMRGQMNIVANSYCAPGFARGIDFIEAQDDPSFINFIDLLVSGGVYNLSDGTFDLNLQAARQESNFSDYVFGNLMRTGNNHYSHDHDDNAGNIGMNARYGILSMWYNTFVEPNPLVDTHNQYNLNYFLNQTVSLADNIIWNSGGNWSINDAAFTSFKMQTNLLDSATLSNATPIWGIGFGATGWSRTTQDNTFKMERPLGTHLSGNLVTDYITTATTPYDSNYVPRAGSAAIGSASAVTGHMTDFDMNYQGPQTPGVYAARTNLTTVGAMDPASAGSVTSIALAPAGPVGLLYPATQQMTATCTYSDGSSADCTSTVAWSNGGSAAFAVSVTGLVASNDVAGTGSVTASQSGVTSGPVTVNVTATPAQMEETYVQTNITEDGAISSYPLIYPIPLLPGSEWLAQFQPVYAKVDLSGAVAVYDGSTFTTITLASGITNTLQAGDAVKNFGITGNTPNMCPVDSATSTTITVRMSSCNGYLPPWLNATAPGLTINSGAYLWKIAGPGMSDLGTAEIINTGTDTTAKYFIQSHDKTAGSSASPSCATPGDYDLHKAACYDTHPVLTNVWPGAIYFQVAPTNAPAACVTTGTIQTHDLSTTCAESFDLKFCTSQAPSKCNVQHFIVTPNGAGDPHAAILFSHPGYRQSFANEQHLYIDSVFGNNDQYVMPRTLTPDAGKTGDAWLEEFDAPAGDGFVQNSTAKLPLFVFHSGTTTNIGYTIHVCPDADPAGECDDDRIFIPDPAAVGGAKPPANPQGVEQVPCAVDPVMTAAGGGVYEIGPSQANPDFFTLTADQNYTWGSIFRYHNEGAAGSPTTLHNYAEWLAPTNWSSFQANTTVPSLYVCGIPNQTTGELPVIDGDHSIGNANVSTYTGQGMLLDVKGSVSTPSPDNYTGKIQPMHNVTFANIAFLHANSTYQHYAPGDSGTGSTYAYAMAAIARPYAVQKFTGLGLYASEVSNPLFSDSCGNCGWMRNTTLDSWWEGNHVTLYGNNGSYTEHPFYVQDVRAFVVGNTMGGSVAGSNGTGYGSFRTGRAFLLFNRGVPEGANQTASGSWGDGSVQDYAKYIDVMNAWGPTPGWDGNCSNGSFDYALCTPTGGGGAPAFGGISAIAAFEADHFHSLFAGGNAFKYSTGNCATGIHDTNGGNSLAGQHVEFFWNNNTDCPYSGTAMFEMERPNDSPSTDNEFGTQPMAPTIAWADNNIWWWGNNQPDCPSNGYSSSIRGGDRINFGKNLFHEGQFDPTATNIPIAYGASGDRSCYTGLTRTSNYVQYTGMDPVEAKIGGWTASNFITSSVQPYDSVGMQAFAGSPAANAAMTPQYPMSLYPLVFNAVDANANVTRRINVSAANVPLDMGPADAAGGPTLVSVEIDAPYGTPAAVVDLLYPETRQLYAKCSWSDTTSTDCSSSATWSNGGSTHFVVSVSGLVSANNTAGTGTVTATQSGVASPGVTVNVTVPPPPYVRFGAGARVSGSVRMP